MSALKDDLNERYPNGAQIDEKSKALSKEFWVSIQTLKWEYKRCINDIIPESNSDKRI